MKIGKIVLKIRAADTTFGNYIGGSAELNNALEHTLRREMAFVIPLAESAELNDYDSGINQIITERFGVIVALRNDTTDKDKQGITAYDRLFDIRSELFRAILGWYMNEAESLIYYRGGSLVGFDGAYLWYQFEFEYNTRVASRGTELRYADVILNSADEDEDQAPDDFNLIYANMILAPNEELPYTGDLPLPDGYPDVLIPDMAQAIDMDTDPGAGAFGKGFVTAFDFYNTKFTR